MKRKLFLLLTVLVALLVLVEPSPAGATTPPANGRIAYGGWKGINVMNPDGSEITRLIYSAESEHDPAWSPDGSRLAFVRTSHAPDGNPSGWGIYTANAYGNDVQLVLDADWADDYLSSPTWSPDGTKIAFCGSRDGDYDVYVINVDGTGLVNLTRDNGGLGAYDGGPTWSPDGTQIAFESDRGSGPELVLNDIYVMNAAGGGNVTNLTQTTVTAAEFQPAWSPDGAKIAYTREGHPPYPADIYVMDADGSHQTQLTFGNASDYLGGWSPDSTQIVFSSDRPTALGTHHIFVMNADGSNQTRLTGKGDPGMQPTWQPLPAGTFVNEPTNDAYVVSSSRNRTFNRPVLQVADAKADRNAYLKFNVQDIAAPITGAWLHLYVTNSGPVGGSVYVTAPTYAGTTTPWLETGLTWNNAPPITGSPLVRWGRVKIGRWVDVDVTAAVIAAQAGDGRASFAVVNDSADLVGYSSGEGAHAPELVVVTE